MADPVLVCALVYTGFSVDSWATIGGLSDRGFAISYDLALSRGLCRRDGQSVRAMSAAASTSV